MKTTRTKIIRHENGLIEVDQGTYGEFTITYNPDDDRFYVTRDETTCATFIGTTRGLSNAKDYIRKHSQHV